MTTEIQVTFDSADPIALSRFWAEALHYVIQPPPGRHLEPGEDPIAAWMEFLEQAGVPEERRGDASAVVDPEGRGPRIFFQRVPEGKTAKNRVHLDLRAAPGRSGDDRMGALEAECERLVALGATRQRRFEPDGGLSAGFIVMQDPEGNEFCLD
ncbi:glyoxalase [Nocardioides gansuensis]|uniref:Glyoxalase n=1 Tax=Nocardioides gansuensis TaxID=2138300 RepID=A0A2T8FCC7_9ACTN|nr:VOC family protein [Nocardioides gansuensis]PVG83364.1 glyoxalase [Nocardioides gansuensis]